MGVFCKLCAAKRESSVLNSEGKLPTVWFQDLVSLGEISLQGDEVPV